MQDAYNTYLDIDIVSSQHEFSTTILGMKPSYLSSMKARSRKPSQQVFERLLQHARLFLFSCNRNPHLHKPYAVKLNHAHQKLSELVRKLEEELFVIWASELEV